MPREVGNSTRGPGFPLSPGPSDRRGTLSPLNGPPSARSLPTFDPIALASSTGSRIEPAILVTEKLEPVLLSVRVVIVGPKGGQLRVDLPLDRRACRELAAVLGVAIPLLDASALLRG